MKLNTKKGFTLVELMTVVSIVIIFSSVVYVGLAESRKKSRDAVRQGDLKSLSLAAQRYFSEYFEFPAEISDLGQYFADGAPESIPSDPMTGVDYFYKRYDISGTHKYCFAADMETNVDGPDTPDADCTPTAGYDYIIKGP